MHTPHATWDTARAQLTRGDDGAFRRTFAPSVQITDEDIFRCRRHMLGTNDKPDFDAAEDAVENGESVKRVPIESRKVTFRLVAGNWLASEKWCVP